jgi:hypothetical protein
MFDKELSAGMAKQTVEVTISGELRLTGTGAT